MGGSAAGGGGDSRKWMILVATTWLQAFTGTNFDFSSYSTQLKSVLGVSQVHLNYLSVASDLGKAFGWCSGVCLFHFPLWVVLFMAAFLGLFGYGFQWLLLQGFVSLPYPMVFLLCLSAGCSICWFNTVCFVLCIKHFPVNRPLAVSLSVSFNGVSAALYNLVANSINSSDTSIYLILNALIPLVASFTLLPVIRPPPPPQTHPQDVSHHDSVIFSFLYALGALTGLYLLLLDPISSNASIARILLLGAIFLLILPLITPGIFYARQWAQDTIQSGIELEGSTLGLLDGDDFELEGMMKSDSDPFWNNDADSSKVGFNMLEKDQLRVLGEEHSAKLLLSRCDFWLYYIAYFCGGTIGLVYSNNLGQISESLGHSSQTSALVTLYSICSFFGRLLSAAPDFLHHKVVFARTGWLALSLVPMPIGFFLLVLSGSYTALSAATGLMGLCSGFIFSAAVSITSELFGPCSAGVNHNILITNIPLGSLLYGLLAANVYNNSIDGLIQVDPTGESMVCMGRKCYFDTFIWWGIFSLFGVASSILLFLRTRSAYGRFQSRNWAQLL